MSFRSWFADRLQGGHLLSVLLELTYRCNLDCFFCYNDLDLKGRSLDRQQYFDLLEELADLQAFQLTLSGGEPLAHPDFLAIGAQSRELGFVVRIKSNGHALRGRLAREIRDRVDPFLIEISLHGARPETHDRQTRIPGSFARLLQNLEEIRTLGLRVRLKGTLTRWNEDEIDEMFGLADELGLVLSLSPVVTPRDDGNLEPLSIAPSHTAVVRLMQRLDSRVPGKPPVDDFASRGLNCGAGFTGLAIDPFGNVYPCVQWRKSLGNLHHKTLPEIWADTPAIREVRDANRESARRKKALGDQGIGLSHCMGLSAETQGDPTLLEPEALERASILREVQGKAVLPILP